MKAVQTKEEKARALEILEKAFNRSPGIIWMLGEKCNRRKTQKLLSVFLEEAVVKEGAFLTNDYNGVVLFFQLHNNKGSVQLLFKKLYAFLFLMGLRRGIQAIKYKKSIDAIRPKKGWLGWLVATDSDACGKAAAYEIKNWMFQRSDETKEPIFVETTVPRVMILYKAAGYKEYAKIKHPYQNIDIWFMKRDPQLTNS